MAAETVRSSAAIPSSARARMPLNCWASWWIYTWGRPDYWFSVSIFSVNFREYVRSVYMLVKAIEPERIPPSATTRFDFMKLVVAAKDETAAAKLYAGLVRAQIDSKNLSREDAEDIVTRELVT